MGAARDLLSRLAVVERRPPGSGLSAEAARLTVGILGQFVVRFAVDRDRHGYSTMRGSRTRGSVIDRSGSLVLVSLAAFRILSRRLQLAGVLVASRASISARASAPGIAPSSKV